MKSLKLIGFSIIAIFMCLSFWACSDNKEDRIQEERELIIGLWENIYFYERATFHDGNVTETTSTERNMTRVSYNADGTGSTFQNKDGNWTKLSEWTWTYDGITLYTYRKDTKITEEQQINKITESELASELHITIEHEGHPVDIYQRSVLERVR